MNKFYYASKISDNMARTPEGFLICFNVPIGRTGEYKYLSSEIGGNGNEIISVFRTDEELFNKVAIASFEGKAFTDDHPTEDVTPDNWSMYSKGEISNIRRGSGEYRDCLVADIIVRDPITIDEIENGLKREVSSGYTCDYVEQDGKIYQKNIRGNHVSLVKAGRAGSRVAIKDDNKKIEIKKRINKKIFDMMYKGYEISHVPPEKGRKRKDGKTVSHVSVYKDGEFKFSSDTDKEAMHEIDGNEKDVRWRFLKVDKRDNISEMIEIFKSDMNTSEVSKELKKKYPGCYIRDLRKL